MRKYIFGITLLILALLITACGSGNDEGKGASDGDSYKIRLAGIQPDDHPQTLALNKFADTVREETDGRIDITVYPASQLGDYTTVYKEVLQGTIEMSLSTTPSEMDSRLDLLMMPYLVTGYENIEETLSMDSFILQKMQEFNNEHGAQLLGVYASGFGGLGSSKEVKSLLDNGKDKDVLIRTAPGPVFAQPMKDLGFRTTTIPYADLSSALQTGTADGFTGGDATANYLQFRDLIKYYYTTNDFFNAEAFYINKTLWDGMGEEDQSIISEAANDMMLTSFEDAQEIDAKYRDEMREKGIEVTELSEEEISQLADYVRENTWPKFKDEMGEELIDELIEALK